MTQLDKGAKYAAEIAFWQSRFDAERGRLRNAHYRRLMLGMAQQPLSGKIVADFGCGPRGSLCWATPARLRIGIDVLADEYMRFNIREHDLCDVCSSESSIPPPTGYVDVMFTLNAIDHVDNFEQMCREILRVLAPGGAFHGSFNLEEPATACEPQTLTEERVRRELFDRLEDVTVRMAAMGDSTDAYSGFFDGSAPPSAGQRFMWASGRKPAVLVSERGASSGSGKG